MDIVLDASAVNKMIFLGDTHTKEVVCFIKGGLIGLVLSKKIEYDWGIGFCKAYINVAIKTQLLDLRNMVQSAKAVVDISSLGRYINPHTTQTFSNDPGDDKYIHCAIDSGSSYILAYDGDHLLALDNQIKNSNGDLIRIYSPYQFIQEHKLLRKLKVSSK
jgi:predicted nucleic acid-binding protein